MTSFYVTTINIKVRKSSSDFFTIALPHNAKILKADLLESQVSISDTDPLYTCTLEVFAVTQPAKTSRNFTILRYGEEVPIHGKSCHPEYVCKINLLGNEVQNAHLIEHVRNPSEGL